MSDPKGKYLLFNNIPL